MAPPTQDSTCSGNYMDPTFLLEKLKSIQRLETELEATSTSRHEDGRDPQVRIRLCELYSGCLLRNPSFSLENNILDRLWRNCFYQRIGEERKEISRRKRKNPESVTKATTNFNRFLQEAIDLYGYLVKFYISLVAPPDASVEGSQNYDLTQDDLDDSGKAAVVAILHRFEIYLGDLNRYRELFSDASWHYERAAMLAPGQGNPYNQLAVLEQLKDSSCNALYWYARSIKASKKSFETSLANVERLFASNRKWLLENPENSLALTPKKAGAEAPRSRKTIASKHFAASFVDLQQSLREVSNPSVDGQVARRAVLEKMDSVFSAFESLLSNNGLSDTLLCRMLVINSFTVSQFEGPLTKALVWRFGIELAKRVESGVNKISVFSSDCPGSIRGLAPLLLTCDYVSHFNSVDDDVEGSEAMFWSKVCEVANQVEPLVHTLKLKDALIKGKLPKEYGDMIGFTPFETFIEPPDDFLSIDNVKEVLPLLQASSSVSFKKQSQENATNVLDTRIKLARLLTIVDLSPKVKTASDGTYHFIGAEEVIDCNDADDFARAEVDDSTMESFVEPETHDLIYRAPEYGGGPPLLVPGALLLGKASNSSTERKGISLDSWRDVVVDGIEMSDSSGPFNSLTPTQQKHITLTNRLPTPINCPSPIAKSTSHTSVPPGLRPPPGLPLPPGFEQQVACITTEISQPPTIQPPSWDFLSLQSTSNPFVRPVTASFPKRSNPPSDPNDFLDQDETMTLLDSSLLQSIWFEDTNQVHSKNPFLAETK